MEPIIIENLQVWPEDLGEMTWDEAMEKVKELGEGWRLPTIEEFKETLYPNRDRIPKLEESYYWSSSESNANFVRYFLFFNGSAFFNSNKYTTYYVRAVRDFNAEVALELLLKEF